MFWLKDREKIHGKVRSSRPGGSKQPSCLKANRLDHCRFMLATKPQLVFRLKVCSRQQSWLLACTNYTAQCKQVRLAIDLTQGIPFQCNKVGSRHQSWLNANRFQANKSTQTWDGHQHKGKELPTYSLWEWVAGLQGVEQRGCNSGDTRSPSIQCPFARSPEKWCFTGLSLSLSLSLSLCLSLSLSLSLFLP